MSGILGYDEFDRRIRVGWYGTLSSKVEGRLLTNVEKTLYTQVDGAMESIYAALDGAVAAELGEDVK